MQIKLRHSGHIFFYFALVKYVYQANASKVSAFKVATKSIRKSSASTMSSSATTPQLTVIQDLHVDLWPYLLTSDCAMFLERCYARVIDANANALASRPGEPSHVAPPFVHINVTSCSLSKTLC